MDQAACTSRLPVHGRTELQWLPAVQSTLELQVTPSFMYVVRPVRVSRAAEQASCPPALPAGELAGVLAAAACAVGGHLKVSCSSKALLLGSAASSPRPYTLHSTGTESAGDC